MDEPTIEDLTAGAEEPKLADLTEGMLDGPTLFALLDDLEACATVLDVIVKGGATSRTDAKTWGLREAAELLTSGQTHGIQIRYRYEGAEWRDTLLWTPGGVRIVRMNMDDLGLEP